MSTIILDKLKCVSLHWLRQSRQITYIDIDLLLQVKTRERTTLCFLRSYKQVHINRSDKIY